MVELAERIELMVKLPSKATLFLVSALAVAMLLPPRAALAQDDEKPRWVLSARIGGASTDVDEVREDGHESGVFTGLGVGLALRDNVILAIEFSAWRRGDNWLGAIWLPAATFYPGLGGLNLRAGLGVTALETVDVVDPEIALPFQDLESDRPSNASGFGLMGGLGYDWKLGSRFLAGPRFEAGWLSYEDDRTALYFSLNVGASFVL